MIRLEKRSGRGFEVQSYDKNGNNSTVFAMKDVFELANFLAEDQWAAVQSMHYNFTVWYNGERWGNCCGSSDRSGEIPADFGKVEGR